MAVPARVCARLVALFWRIPKWVFVASSATCLAASVACWVALVAVADNPEAWTASIAGAGALIVAGIAAWIAWQAKGESARSADAAEGSHQITELQEERRKHGWRIEPHPDKHRHILRNMGTLTATDVRFGEQSKHFVLQFASRVDGGQVDIAPGEARAFDLLKSFSSTGVEIQIDWLPEGEATRRKWTEVTSHDGAVGDSERREDQSRENKFRAEDRSNERSREYRELILQLGDAYADWIAAREDAGKKLRVQLLAASLPPGMAREIGHEVDVLKDAWGRGWFPLEDHVAAEDAHLLDGVLPHIELVWNMHQLSGYRVQYADEHLDRIQEPTIQWAIRGYVERVKERQSGERKTRWTAAEQAELDARFAQADAAMKRARREADMDSTDSDDRNEPDDDFTP